MIYPRDFRLNTLLIIPAVAIFLSTLALVVIILSIIGARYKDLGPAINAFMTIAFFSAL